MHSFADEMSLLYPVLCSTVPYQSHSVNPDSLPDLLQPGLNTFDGEEAQYCKDACHLWNCVINTG